MTLLANSTGPGETVLVSVAMTTFNHAAYIRTAIDSVLQQLVGGRCEIVIGEDCSTDGTREIVSALARTYPDVIKLVLPEQNLGYNGNAIFEQVLAVCSGRYVAMLDGDDYWLSNQKLAKQIEFLEARPQLSACFHNVLVVYEDRSKSSHPFHVGTTTNPMQRGMPPMESTVADLIGGNYIQTCSTLYRNRLFSLPAWYKRCPIGDWPIHLLNAAWGPIGYLDEILAAYRVHSGGVWSLNMSRMQSGNHVEELISMYDLLDRHFDFQFHARIHAQSHPLLARAARLSRRSGNWDRAGEFAARYFEGRRVPRWHERDLAAMVVRSRISQMRSKVGKSRSTQ